MKRKEILLNIKKNKMAYLCIAPFFILFTIFVVAPVVSSIALSFTYYNVLQPPEWVGLDNYAKMFFSDDIFMKSLINTLLMAVIVGPVGYLGSLLLAWMINELPHGIRTAMVLFVYAPSITGNAYVVWSLLFSGDSNGYINAFLQNLGLVDEPIQWFTDTTYMMPLIIIISLWMSMGAGFLSFVAGLKGLDRSLYEAGMLDGIGNRWQELWFITLPQLKPQLLFGAVMAITNAFSIGAIVDSLCGSPSTDYAVHTIINHINDYGGARFDMGYSAALSTVLFLMMYLSKLLIGRMLKNVGT